MAHPIDFNQKCLSYPLSAALRLTPDASRELSSVRAALSTRNAFTSF